MTEPPTPLEGLEGFDGGDVSVPRYRVCQPTSASLKDKGATEGQFFDDAAGASFESSTIVPLLLQKKRVMFEEGADKPTCKSEDNKVPSVPEPQAPACTEMRGNRAVEICKNAIWKDRVPPICRLVYELTALDLDRGGVPFRLQIKGTATPAAKKLAQQVMMNKVSLFDLSCTMSLYKKKNARGSFYVIDFGGFEVLERGTHRAAFLDARAYDAGQGVKEDEESIIPF